MDKEKEGMSMSYRYPPFDERRWHEGKIVI
jgi:hypothetical protein